MADDILITAELPALQRPERQVRGEAVGAALAPMWGGMLDEFRNHLERLSAGTGQLRDRLPLAAASDLAPALCEMEASIDSLSALTSWMYAVSSPGAQVISDLDDVIERALAMARPLIRRDVRIAVGSRVGAVRNRRGAVECALAAMIVSLARASDARPGSRAQRQETTQELKIDVFSTRGLLALEIESNADRPGPLAQSSSSSSSSFSWRWTLAERLIGMVGGTLERLSDKVGVGLRFQ